MVAAAGAPGMTGAEIGQGRRAQSVGHQAKAAVAAARESGAVLPGNAQGLAASAVARGADPAALFASLVAPETPAGTDAAPSDDMPEAVASGDDAQSGANEPAPDPVLSDTGDAAPNLLQASEDKET